MPMAAAGLVTDLLADGEAKLNLLLSDGRAIVATTWQNSLFSLVDAGLAEGGVLLASEPLDEDPAWTRVPDGSLIEATGTTVTITPLSSSGGTT